MALVDAFKREDANELFEGFFAVERELRSLFDERMSAFDLTYSQFVLLRFIQKPRDATGTRKTEPVLAKDIAEHFTFSPRTVTVAINVLVKKKFVARRPSRVDGRSWDIVVTDEGRSAFKNASHEFERMCAAMAAMPRTHWHALWHAIPRLLTSIEGLRRKGRLQKRGAVLLRMLQKQPRNMASPTAR